MLYLSRWGYQFSEVNNEFYIQGAIYKHASKPNGSWWQRSVRRFSPGVPNPDLSHQVLYCDGEDIHLLSCANTTEHQVAFKKYHLKNFEKKNLDFNISNSEPDDDELCNCPY